MDLYPQKWLIRRGIFKVKIVADDKIPFLHGVFEQAGCDVVYLPGRKTDKYVLADADAVITRTRTKCNADMLTGSKVKIAATATIGLDHFNTSELDELGISWCNAPGCNSSSVAQYITSVITAFGDYAGKTIGIIGAGNVGSKVASRAAALGMNVLINDPPRAEKEGTDGFADLSEIMEKADFITIFMYFHNKKTRQNKFCEFKISIFKEQIHFMAKAELFKNGLFRVVLGSAGVFAVDRGKGDMGAINKAQSLIKEGKILGIYPEGTRHTEGAPRRAKSGVAYIAMDTNADILPVSVYREGKYSIFRKTTMSAQAKKS